MIGLSKDDKCVFSISALMFVRKKILMSDNSLHDHYGVIHIVLKKTVIL